MKKYVPKIIAQGSAVDKSRQGYLARLLKKTDKAWGVSFKYAPDKWTDILWVSFEHGWWKGGSEPEIGGTDVLFVSSYLYNKFFDSNIMKTLKIKKVKDGVQVSDSLPFSPLAVEKENNIVELERMAKEVGLDIVAAHYLNNKQKLKKMIINKLAHFDSTGMNKKYRYAVETIMKAGLSHDKAMALAAYHGSLGNIKKMDAKGLRKFKYLQDVITEKEAIRVVDFFKGKKVISRLAGITDAHLMNALASIGKLTAKKTIVVKKIEDKNL